VTFRERLSITARQLGCWPPVHVAWRNSVTSVTFNTNTHQTVTVLPKAANKCVDQEWKYFLELGGFSGNRKQSRNVATLSVIPMQIKRCGKRPVFWQQRTCTYASPPSVYTHTQTCSFPALKMLRNFWWQNYERKVSHQVSTSFRFNKLVAF